MLDSATSDEDLTIGLRDTMKVWKLKAVSFSAPEEFHTALAKKSIRVIETRLKLQRFETARTFLAKPREWITLTSSSLLSSTSGPC